MKKILKRITGIICLLIITGSLAVYAGPRECREVKRECKAAFKDTPEGSGDIWNSSTRAFCKEKKQMCKAGTSSAVL